ncbi:Hypothetical predicted protein [Paramuricea clavata]|uniref:Uncharacterized protein n=1 Tax=Paramuricea clavata TaxID=317549 RepID=A0A7D9HGQ5_PARCT|nr:Hypothetical predicted protein [Paramuricea clavata]
MSELQLCWTGNIEQLKHFVNENIKLNDGNWISPGGDKKVYSDGTTSISWRKSKKILQIEGKEKKQIIAKLCSLICSVQTNIVTNEAVATTTSDENGVSPLTTQILSVELEGAKLDIAIAERDILINKDIINNVDNRLNKINAEFDDFSQQLEYCKKEIYILRNGHIVKSL